jgi:hypothetical protein
LEPGKEVSLGGRGTRESEVAGEAEGREGEESSAVGLCWRVSVKNRNGKTLSELRYIAKNDEDPASRELAALLIPAEEDILAGRTSPAEEVVARMHKKYSIPKNRRSNIK